MKLDITKIAIEKQDPKDPMSKIQAKGLQVKKFKDYVFPTHRSGENKEVVFDNCPEGYRDAFPWCSISEDEKEIHVHESPSETRVYRVNEKMPVNYYNAFIRVLELCQARIELFDLDDEIAGDWSGDSEATIVAAKTVIKK